MYRRPREGCQVYGRTSGEYILGLGYDVDHGIEPPAVVYDLAPALQSAVEEYAEDGAPGGIGGPATIRVDAYAVTAGDDKFDDVLAALRGDEEDEYNTKTVYYT